MNPIEQLISGAIHYEVDLNKNPYLTLETIILRLYKKISQYTQVYPSDNEKTILFAKWHNDILEVYQDYQSKLSQDEKSCFERILSKDSPHAFELTKFAICLHKYNEPFACKLFAVDGFLSSHPKFYVQDAFSTQFSKHNDAVRALYEFQLDPLKIREIVEKAFLINENEIYPMDEELKKHVSFYTEMVGKEEMMLVAKDRKDKLQPCKRKKT